MGRLNDLRWMCGIALAALLTSAGCGGNSNGGEFVWLQVVNGYPGSQAASVYGPSGTIASNLEFGQRTDEFIRVNRNLGTEIQVVLDGAPQPFTAEAELYSMYPQESATLFISRRSGAGQVDVDLIRHVQSALADSASLRSGYSNNTCRTVLANRLAVDSSGTANWTMIPRMQIQSACTGYARFVDTYDACDPVLGRPQLMQAMFGPNACDQNPSFDTSQASQWFVPVDSSGSGTEPNAIASVSECAAVGGSGSGSPPFDTGEFRGEGTLEFVYAGPSKVTSGNASQTAYAADVDPATGQISGPQSTLDFMDCIGYDPQLTLAENKMEIEGQQVEQCRAGSTFSATGLEPGGELSQELIISTSPGIGVNRGPQQCGYPIQITSDFLNVFDDPEDGEPSLVNSQDKPITYAPGQHYFWFLYGRPINPRIASWSVEGAGETPGGTIDPGKYPDGDR